MIRIQAFKASEDWYHSAMKLKSSYRVKFSTRGRVTIPAPLREKYGIKGGLRVAFEVTPSGAFMLKPVVLPER